MMATNVTGIYLHVVQDVINNVRADFQSEGVDEAVLLELQSLWELKMMQSGTILNTASAVYARGGSTPVTHDLNVPYEATEEYMTPTAEMLFPPTPVTNTVEPVMYQYFPPAPTEHASTLETGINEDVKIGRPSLYMPAPWTSQKALGVDVNVAYEEGREDEERQIGQLPVTKEFFTWSNNKRKREDYAPDFFSGSYIPQQDGADDTCLSLMSSGEELLIHQRNSGSSTTEGRAVEDSVTGLVTPSARPASCGIPQLDGGFDNYNDDAADNYDGPGEADPERASEIGLKTPKVAESDDSEPPLNEDDDDDDLDDLGQGDEDPKTDHLVVAQFEKVTRSKNKWKCILKDGVMHLNRRDYLFSKANGEFEF